MDHLYLRACLAGPQRRYRNNHGIALVTALMFIVVVALLGATATTITTVSSQASGNYKARSIYRGL